MTQTRRGLSFDPGISRFRGGSGYAEMPLPRTAALFVRRHSRFSDPFRADMPSNPRASGRSRFKGHPPLTRLTFKPAAVAAAALVALSTGSFADEIETIVITGATTERRLVDAPYAISVVDGEALRSAGPMINLSEALAKVPGLVVNNRSNYAQDLQISSRGFGARATFGVRGLRLYSDGIPATMPDGQGQVAHFDLAGAERVEVLRGPFSVLYGNSSGGVIALFSAPVIDGRAEAAVDAGSFGLRQYRLGVAAPVGRGLTLAVDASQVSLDGFRPQSAADRTLGSARLVWQDGGDRVVFQAGAQDQKAGDPLGLTRALFDADPRQTTPEAAQFNTRKTIQQTQGGVSWRHAFGADQGLLRSEASLYAGSRGVTQFQAIPVATQRAATQSGGVVDFDRTYGGADARLVWRLGSLDLVTGVAREELRDNRRGYENFTGTGASQVLGVVGKLRRDEVDRATTQDAYAQADWALAPGWGLTAGLRSGSVRLSAVDHYIVTGNGDDSGSKSFHYTNPVLGLRWTATPALTLHASAARGFEAPTLSELAYKAAGGGGLNTGLRAQTSHQLEFGARLRLARDLALDAAVFEIATRDELGVLTNSGGRSAYQNVGRTRRSGAEFGANWRISRDWRAQLALSWLDATYRDAFLTCTGAPCTAANVPVAAGNRIAGTQPANATAEIAWQPFAGADTALEWRAAGRTPVNDVNNDFAAGWSALNLRWLQRFDIGAGGQIEALARVENLLDRRYAGSVIVNDANGRFFEPASPRSLLLSLRYLRRF
jgi:iron complex outermembrane receptor protein